MDLEDFQLPSAPTYTKEEFEKMPKNQLVKMVYTAQSLMEADLRLMASVVKLLKSTQRLNRRFIFFVIELCFVLGLLLVVLGKVIATK